jgi:hypothetical protein
LTTTLPIKEEQERTQPIEKSELNVFHNPQNTDWLEFGSPHLSLHVANTVSTSPFLTARRTATNF